MKTREEMIDRLVAEAQQQGSAASEFEPSDETCGLLSSRDVPPAIGGGIGSLLWFSSREELFDCIGRLLPFLAPGPGEAVHLAVAAAGQAVVRRFAAGELKLGGMLVELNHALRRASPVCWLGRFGELKTADVEWVRQIRRFVGLSLQDEASRFDGVDRERGPARLHLLGHAPLVAAWGCLPRTFASKWTHEEWLFGLTIATTV